MAGLTIKQEAFCQAYIETGNASEAYRRGYLFPSQSPSSGAP
ncbi:terminase small subunit [Enterobacter ludwigii]|nr:terminase small subunit [Enterobacter ludwigii]WNI43772.1 terminase small subunit [Enterobacter ludwigii]WNI55526.1 terminase small subunit [Enterobacter ludwigii]WNI80567.1 terminase small subunit [Enterobacter ludwigii]